MNKHALCGVTLREYAAVEIVAAMLTQTSIDHGLPNPHYCFEGMEVKDNIAQIAVAFADALIDELNRTGEKA